VAPSEPKFHYSGSSKSPEMLPSVCAPTSFLAPSLWIRARSRTSFDDFRMVSPPLLSTLLLAGMNWLHQSSLIHRDFKLSNLLVDDNYNVKVCDFGLTQVKQDRVSQSNIKGSPLYMAPGAHLPPLSFPSVPVCSSLLGPFLPFPSLPFPSLACFLFRGVLWLLHGEVRCL